MDTLATEMLKELKASSKRKDIIIMILIAIILISNIAWLVYESQFETISDQEQVIDTDNSSNSIYIQTLGE